MEGAADVLAPEGINALASFVIRPPRASYSRRDLGDRQFILDDVHCTRTDVDLQNPRGLTLKCSHFEPAAPQNAPPPAVVYLHGNGSCRVEATMLLQYILPYGLSLFSFDFSGSGRSGGEYISLGVYEKHDVATVVDYLVNDKKVPKVALWGHSMGAATALMYAGHCKNNISALIVDSSFQSFEKLAEAMVAEMPLPTAVPRKLVLSIGVRAVRRNVRERASFDVHDIDPMSAIKKLTSHTAPPAFFLHGLLDNIVPPSHSTALHAAYPSNRKYVRYLPDLHHDSPRPDDVLENLFEFLQSALATGGPASHHYLSQLKSRGNLCMINSRFSDASFLYSKALDALALACTGGPDFATVTGNVEQLHQGIDPKGKSSSSHVSRRRTTNQRNLFTSPRSSTASPATTKRSWRTRFQRRSNDGGSGGPLSDSSIIFPNASGPASLSSNVGDFEELESGLTSTSQVELPSNSKNNSKARSFLQGFRKYRIRNNGDGKRRTRSGRFSTTTRFSNYGDRKDEFRSLGSSTENNNNMRRSGPLSSRNGAASFRNNNNQPDSYAEINGTAVPQSNGLREAENDEGSGFLRMSSEDAGNNNGPLSASSSRRKSFGIFRRNSQSQAPGNTEDNYSKDGYNNNNDEYTSAVGRARTGNIHRSKLTSRFSHDGGWRRIRSRMNRVDNNNSGPNSSGIPTNGTRSASIDMAMSGDTYYEYDLSKWAMNDTQKNITLALLGNRSLARRKMGNNNAALIDAIHCLRLDPTWMRGYLRKAAALKQAGKLEAARAATLDGLKIDNTHTQLIELLDNIQHAIDTNNNEEEDSNTLEKRTRNNNAGMHPHPHHHAHSNNHHNGIASPQIVSGAAY